MKSLYYLNCCEDQLIRSKEEQEQIIASSQRLSSSRFSQRLASEVVFKIEPEDIALPYPLLLTLFLEGQHVMRADVEIGWQHQGIEKSMESCSWNEAAHLLRRIDPTQNSPLSIAYQLALDLLFDVERTNPLYLGYLRIARLESDRVLYTFNYLWRLLDMLGLSTKSNAMRELIVIASKFSLIVSGDITRVDTHLEMLACLKLLSQKAVPVLTTLNENQHLKTRLEGLAKVDSKEALSYGLTGVTLRAAGLGDDVRINHPQLPYSMLGFAPHTGLGGDAYARVLVRLWETEQSLQIIEKALTIFMQECPVENPPHAPAHLANAGFPKPRQVVTSYVEAPEGEVAITLCSNGTAQPYRVRIKTPSFSLTSAIPVFLYGCRLDEVILILATLGINTLHNDR